MSIHSKFRNAREPVWRGIFGGLGRPLTVRDGHRQRCYNAEFASLRPIQSAYTSREAAKGFARLCAKIAIKRMVATGLIKDDAMRQRVRASFRSCFASERINHCDGDISGVYFCDWGWSDVIIAHEVAHWADQWAHVLRGACNAMATFKYEPHGPCWRGWFSYILADATSGRISASQIAAMWAGARLPVILP